MLKQEFRKFIIMDTKSNEFNGNWFKGMLNLWKKDVSWSSKSRKEKTVCVWFALSFIFILVLSHTWLFFPAFVSFILSLVKVTKIKMEE